MRFHRRPFRRPFRVAGLAAVLAAVLAAMLAAALLAACTHHSTHASSPPSASRTSAAGPAPAPPGGSGALPGGHAAAATSARISGILANMNAKAFNPQATPVKGATRPGGLFINWRGSWQGSQATAGANTNLQGSGISDQQAGGDLRHDPAVDLVYLVSLYAYSAAHPVAQGGDTSFAADAARMEPIVRQEYANVGYYRCWLYFQLRDLAALRPAQAKGWDAIAGGYAAGVYRRYYDRQAGTITDPRHDGIYRTDFAAECAAMLIDAGRSQHQAAWTDAGTSALAHLIRRARNPVTHLFALQMRLGATRDTVVQAQLKVGEEAQLLNSFLDAYDLTGNRSYIAVVTSAVDSLYSPHLGLWDPVHGGFFDAVDMDGRHLRTGYKETRQAWMLPLLGHLARIEGGSQWTGRERAMLSVVRDKLWQPGIGGYPYREEPGFTVYVSHEGPARTLVTEDWVTAEAMGIACESLESQLIPLTLLPAGNHDQHQHCPERILATLPSPPPASRDRRAGRRSRLSVS